MKNRKNSDKLVHEDHMKSTVNIYLRLSRNHEANASRLQERLMYRYANLYDSHHMTSQRFKNTDLII